jgi:ADP-heptose:LPS heptosyltransferase
MNFDLVLYGHRSNLLSFVLRLCGIKYRLGFEGTKYLTHTARFNENIRVYVIYKAVLSASGIKTDSNPPLLKKQDTSLLRKKYGFPTDAALIGIFPYGGTNPGTNMPIKRWGLENYFKLAEKIKEEYPDAKIIFYEGKQDSEKYSVPGRINASIAVIDNDCLACCDYFISNDTGSLHIAAALGVSTISIFGPTDPRILAPANAPGEPHKHTHIWKQPECSPCYTPKTAIDRDNPKYWAGNTFICNTGTHICMKSITVDAVYETVKMIIEHRSAVSF